MRSKIQTNNNSAIASYIEWIIKQVDTIELKEKKSQIANFDYDLIIGSKINGKVVIKVIPVDDSIHLYFDDGTDNYNFKKEDIYQSYQTYKSNKKEETAC